MSGRRGSLASLYKGEGFDLDFLKRLSTMREGRSVTVVDNPIASAQQAAAAAGGASPAAAVPPPTPPTSPPPPTTDQASTQPRVPPVPPPRKYFSSPQTLIKSLDVLASTGPPIVLQVDPTTVSIDAAPASAESPSSVTIVQGAIVPPGALPCSSTTTNVVVAVVDDVVPPAQVPPPEVSKIRISDVIMSPVKKVRFVNATEYFHERLIGGSGGVPSSPGVDLGIGWKCVDTQDHDPNTYGPVRDLLETGVGPEDEKLPPQPVDPDEDPHWRYDKDGQVPVNERRAIMKAAGHTAEHIAAAEKELQVIRDARFESARSIAGRKVMNGEDPDEVEQWEREMLAKEAAEKEAAASAAAAAAAAEAAGTAAPAAAEKPVVAEASAVAGAMNPMANPMMGGSRRVSTPSVTPPVIGGAGAAPTSQSVAAMGLSASFKSPAVSAVGAKAKRRMSTKT